MTALVTGASGFVGAAVCRALCARGQDVRVLVRAGSDLSNLRDLPVEIATGDVRDRDSLGPACAGCDAVYHVAADYRLWVRDPAAMYAVNVDGTRHVIDAAMAAGVDRIVYTSSVAAIAPRSDGRAADEESPSAEADMIGHYKRSKYLAERCVDERVVTRNAPVVIVNPSTPVGPGDIKPTPTGRLVLDAMRGRIPAFVDTGLNIVHVDDVASGHLAAFEQGTVGRRYILGGEDMSLRELLTLIARIVGRRPPTIAIPRPVALGYAWGAEMLATLTGSEPAATCDGVRMSSKKMYYSSERAAKELGYRWRPPEAAVRDAIAWFRTQQAELHR